MSEPAQTTPRWKSVLWSLAIVALTAALVYAFECKISG